MSIGLVVRDVRRLHLRRRSLADAPMSADGVSPAGAIFFNSQLSH